MKRSRLALLSLLLTLAVWLPVSWPLPAMMSKAISVGIMKRANNLPAITHMMPGDHIQFVYYMWIFSDFLSGRTPWFYNLYEFNTGSDAERYKPGAYYVPFSLAFSAFHAVSNRAFAWNMICLLSLWLAAYSTWRLCRRYTTSEATAALGALLALLFPYQWIQLFGGSPAGFGMALIPSILLGVDRAVRDDRIAGGWLAGAALFFTGTTDAHAFFFGTLIIPCWCFVAFTQRSEFNARKMKSYLRLATSLSPIVLLAAAAYFVTKLGTRHIKQTAAAGGRTIREVALFSPKAEGLWAWRELDVSYHIYFGFLIAALLAIGLLVCIVQALRKRNWKSTQPALVMALTMLGITGIVLLCMGPFSPFDGRIFTAARKYIPNYTMIRQPAKIFVLLPSLLALGATVSLTALRGWMSPRAYGGLIAALALGFSAEYFRQSKLLISTLDDTNEAYAAVAEDARESAINPQVVVIPLWPGDSHYSSIYQHYASLYRIRMINGYRPFVPKDYVDDVFVRFRSINHGVLDDAQISNLLARGIKYVILHEDLFPEKVSPFAVSVTLRNLLEHPHLTLLKQDGPVWAFRIESEKTSHASVSHLGPYSFPARRFEAERQQLAACEKTADPAASGGGFVQLSGEASLAISPVFTPGLPGLRWSLRVRGEGALRISSKVEGLPAVSDASVEAHSRNWVWIESLLPAFADSKDVSAEIAAESGSVDVDMIKLVAGKWDLLTPGETITLPAASFFHAGATDLETGSVCFVPGRDRSDLIFYGPKLPLEPGRYEIAVEVESSSSPGTPLGRWIVACPEGNEIGHMDLIAGQQNRIEVLISNNQPLLCAFLYSGENSLKLAWVRIARSP